MVQALGVSLSGSKSFALELPSIWRRVWDLESGELKKTLEEHAGAVLSICMTVNGKQIISGSDDNTVR